MNYNYLERTHICTRDYIYVDYVDCVTYRTVQ